MKNLLFTIALFASVSSFSQNAHETAFAFMKTGDHDNAILVLNKALQTEPDNEQLMQDIALAYFYKKDFAQAKTYATKLIEKSDEERQENGRSQPSAPKAVSALIARCRCGHDVIRGGLDLIFTRTGLDQL